MTRADNRQANELRELTITPDFAPNATGSVLISTGKTRVICSAMVQEDVPRWKKEQKVSGGWITAEYSMLPYSTQDRKQRDISRGKADGRSVEIQRLIGRSIRAMVDLEALGPRTIWVDCDVLQADGGTRTAGISGASAAIGLALKKLVDDGVLKRSPLKQLIGAVSVGVVDGTPLLDLCYTEDAAASVDANIVMTQAGDFVEVQASGEEATFSGEQFNTLLSYARQGIEEILTKQLETIGMESIM
jgi:ribonuclease PH